MFESESFSKIIGLWINIFVVINSFEILKRAMDSPQKKIYEQMHIHLW